MVSHSPSGRPTSERITPDEIFSEWPEIATPVWFGPKFLENHTPVNLQKFSRGLTTFPRIYLFFRIILLPTTNNQQTNKMKGLVAGSKGGLMGALGAMGKQKTVRHSITRSMSCGYPYFTRVVHA